MEHGEVGVGVFLAAAEDVAETIQPGVGGFDDPAAGAEAGLVFDRLGLFATAADVGGEGKLCGKLTDLVVVVGGVEGTAPGVACGLVWAVRSGSTDRLPGELVVVEVRARRRDPDRDALALGEERSFRPFLGE